MPHVIVWDMRTCDLAGCAAAMVATAGAAMNGAELRFQHMYHSILWFGALISTPRQRSRSLST